MSSSSSSKSSRDGTSKSSHHSPLADRKWRQVPTRKQNKEWAIVFKLAKESQCHVTPTPIPDCKDVPPDPTPTPPSQGVPLRSDACRACESAFTDPLVRAAACAIPCLFG